MYLLVDDHVARHVPYKKLLRDDDDNPVGILPQAFEMREHKNEKALSVNWLEYFGESYAKNIINLIQSFRLYRKKKGYKVGINSAFGIGNVGKIEDVCATHGHKKVRILYNTNRVEVGNESHAAIIRLPINDDNIMQSLASDVFDKLVANKDVPEI